MKKAPRINRPNKIRDLIKRQNGKCHYCAKNIYTIDEARFPLGTLDEFEFNSSNQMENLVASCGECSQYKQGLSGPEFLVLMRNGYTAEKAAEILKLKKNGQDAIRKNLRRS